MAQQRKESEALPIRNTRLRRALTLLALKTTSRFYRRQGVCVPVSRGIIVKSGYFTHISEATTLQFLAEKTSLPVPKVYCSFVHKGRAYTVMERIRGQTLPEAWRNLSEVSRENLFKQLKEMISELRSLKPTDPRAVEGCRGASLYDSRISHCMSRTGPVRMGPFNTIQEFHFWLRGGLIPEETDHHLADEDDWRAVVDMAAKQDGEWPSTVFTHGDLNPFNIIVRDGRIAGIIDWEFSGWYPHYWEYTAAWYGNLTRLQWQGELEKFLTPWPEELEMEKTRQRYWGEY